MGSPDWLQAAVEFTDWESAERAAVTRLRPRLVAAQTDGGLGRWFFIRKHPCWRLRCQPAGGSARQHLTRMLDELTASGEVAGWTAGIYEPEVFAFGGHPAMDVAHALFCADSEQILAYAAQEMSGPAGAPALGRREMAVLLSSVLMRGAGQDWYEQGDVWARVARHRPPRSAAFPAERLSALRSAVLRLMTADAGPSGALVNGGQWFLIPGWPAAFEQAGRALAELATRGTLERGLRAVLAHHLIFFFNRLGLSYTEQSTLATLAREVVMTDETTELPARADCATGPADGADAQTLRQALVAKLREDGVVRSAPVEAALRAVPRHVFLPGVPLGQAYADDTVFTKRDHAGTTISAASQPTIVAMMLEQLDAEPGQHILEIGAGTGYNAALISHLAGDQGAVTAVDIDDDIVAGAREHLTSAGYSRAQVIRGDGALGYPDGAPYDRVIATVGAWDLPPAWLSQLTPDGRLIVPLRLRGSVSRSVVFERDGDHWRARSSEMCTFMPLRGIADDTRRIIKLTPEGTVTLWTHQDQDFDPAALSSALSHPRHEAWTGVTFGPAESFEWLDLWLACTMPNALSRMPVEPQAMDNGLVSPMFRWGAMATMNQDSLAYLTRRPAPSSSHGSRHEVGVIAHGPAAGTLVDQVTSQVRTWDGQYRSRTPRIELQPAGLAAEPASGQFICTTPRNRLVISWD